MAMMVNDPNNVQIMLDAVRLMPIEHSKRVRDSLRDYVAVTMGVLLDYKFHADISKAIDVVAVVLAVQQIYLAMDMMNSNYSLNSPLDYPHPLVEMLRHYSHYPNNLNHFHLSRYHRHPVASDVHLPYVLQ